MLGYFGNSWVVSASQKNMVIILSPIARRVAPSTVSACSSFCFLIVSLLYRSVWKESILFLIFFYKVRGMYYHHIKFKILLTFSLQWCIRARAHYIKQPYIIL